MKKTIQKYWELFFFGGFLGVLTIVSVLMFIQPVIGLKGGFIDITVYLVLLSFLIYGFVGYYAILGIDLSDS